MKNRKKIEKYVLDLMADMDPSGVTVEYYKKMFKSMKDADMRKWIDAIEAGEDTLHCFQQNLKKGGITVNDLIAIADKRKVKIFQKYVSTDRDTGREYTSAMEALIIDLPVRRLSQYLAHKRTLPDGDQRINPITGQVVPPDKGAKITLVEMQILAAKGGLNSAIIEMAKMRGGDTRAYADLKNEIEETGSASMADLDLSGRPRAAITASIYLRCAGIDNNIIGD